MRRSFRNAIRSPLFAVATVLSLAVGIGFPSAILSAWDDVYLEKLAVHDPDELVFIEATGPDKSPQKWFSYPDFVAMRRQVKALQSILAYSRNTLLGEFDGASERVAATLVSRNYFATLGLSPWAGSFFSSADEARPEMQSAIVLSHRFWSERLGASRDIIGRGFSLNGYPFTVVGIARPGFRGMDKAAPTDVWLTLEGRDLLSLGAGTDWRHEPNFLWLHLVARKRVAGDAQAEAALNAWDDNREFDGLIRPDVNFAVSSAASGSDVRIGTLSGFFEVLSWAVAAAMLMVFVNISGLLLAKTLGRQEEIAIRMALGANRTHVLWLLFSELALLAFAGGIGAILVAFALLRAFSAFGGASNIKLDFSDALNAEVVLATLATSLLVGFLLALPALRLTKGHLALGTKTGTLSRGTGPGKRRFRRVFIVVQLALTMALLVSSVLLVRSLRTLAGEDLGFAPAKLLIVSLSVDRAIDTPAAGTAAIQDLRDRVKGLPAVNTVSFTSILFGFEGALMGIQVDGYRPARPSEMNIQFVVAGEDYFKALEIPVLQGRAFGPQDVSGSDQVVVVNRALAERFWSGRSAIGQTFRSLDEHNRLATFRIVGVVQDSKYLGLRDSYPPIMYFPYSQRYVSGMKLIVKSALPDPLQVAPSVNRVVGEFAGRIRVLDWISFSQHIEDLLTPLRQQALLISLLGGLSLFLSVSGLFATITYYAAQRRFEIGVRLAIGARPLAISAMVVREALRLCFLSIVPGCGIAYALGRLLQATLYKASPSDLSPYLASAGLLFLTSILASLIPAYGAARTDPAIALKR